MSCRMVLNGPRSDEIVSLRLVRLGVQALGDDYLLFSTPEGPNGGIMKVDTVVPGKSPYIYIDVDEIEPYIEKTKELGGGIDVPKKEIPKVGWYAHLKDPDGNIIGIFQDLKKE